MSEELRMQFMGLFREGRYEEAAKIAEAALAKPEVCEWVELSEYTYETSCGHFPMFCDLSRIKHCPLLR